MIRKLVLPLTSQVQAGTLAVLPMQGGGGRQEAGSLQWVMSSNGLIHISPFDLHLSSKASLEGIADAVRKQC